MARVEIGDEVAFTLPDQDGKDVTVPTGQWTVLFFYPRDDTPGCTLEAKGFRDVHDAFLEAGVVVMGVSTDPPERHERFCGRHDLPFTLVSDTDKELVSELGLKNLLGFAKRRTLVLDPQGVVRKVWGRVSPQGHAEEVLEAVQRLQDGS